MTVVGNVSARRIRRVVIDPVSDMTTFVSRASSVSAVHTGTTVLPPPPTVPIAAGLYLSAECRRTAAPRRFETGRRCSTWPGVSAAVMAREGQRRGAEQLDSSLGS